MPSINPDINLCVAYPNKFSYSETFIRNQINALSPQYLIYEGWYPACYADGYSFLPFPFKYLAVRGSMRNLLPDIYHQLYTNMMYGFIKKHSIHIMLAHYGPMGVTLADACIKAGIPLVVHFHGFDAYHYATLDKYKRAYSRMLRQAKAVIVVSKDMEDQLVNLGALRQNLFCNPYGVYLDKFYGATPGTMPPVFVSVARFAAKKAPLLMLQSFAKLLTLCPKARLKMVGDGELWEESKQLAKQLNIAKSVTFYGAQPPEKVTEILNGARVFVQHSLRAPNGDSEGMPNTILEASAMGLPIVSTFHAGIKDAVIHGESGFLVDEGDIDGMAHYMYVLATNATLAAQMGQRARRHMEENFAMEMRIRSLKEILHAALS